MPEEAEKEERLPRSGDLIIPADDPRDRKVRRSKEKIEPPKPVGWLAYLLLLLVTIGAYSPIFQSDMLWSPYDQVERSSFRSMESLSEAWSIESIRHGNPIELTSYFLEEKIPLNPAITHHAINLLLHVTAALLLLRVLEYLKFAGAFSAAFVFALHPTVLQTVFWAGYRGELIGLILILFALIPAIRNRNSRDFLLLVVVSIIAYFVHPASLVLPLLVGLCIFYSNKGYHLQDYNRLLPLICFALFIGVWTQSGRTGLDMDMGDRLSIYAQNLIFYLKQALIPVELSLFHPLTRAQGYNVGAQNSFLPFVLFIPFFILIACNYRKNWARGIFLGLAAFLCLIIYGMTQIGQFIDGAPAHEDHLFYVALPAIIALVVCSAAGIAHNIGAGGRVLWYLGFSLFLVVQITITSSYSLAVSKPPEMWKNLSDQWPASWLPKLALIDTIQKEGGESELLTTQEMIKMLENILEQQPDRVEERILLSRIYREEGENTNALREYKRVLRESEPDNEYLAEAAEFYDKLGLTWDANNARERITSN